MQTVKLMLGCIVLTHAIKLQKEEKTTCESINIPKVEPAEAKVVSEAAKKEVIAAQTSLGPVKRRRAEKAAREAEQKRLDEELAAKEEQKTTATTSETKTTPTESTSGKKIDVNTAQVSEA